MPYVDKGHKLRSILEIIDPLLPLASWTDISGSYIKSPTLNVVSFMRRCKLCWTSVGCGDRRAEHAVEGVEAVHC
jgi:hypothetical protein